MNDYIEIQKLWHDLDLIKVRITCSSLMITALSEIYVSDRLIDDLIYKIKLFLSGKVSETFWANENKGNNSTACVNLRFLHKDRRGHILIEVYMEIDDGGDFNIHNCCFYVNTEIGLLTTFCENLPVLKQKQLKAKVVLNENI